MMSTLSDVIFVKAQTQMFEQTSSVVSCVVHEKHKISAYAYTHTKLETTLSLKA